MRGIKGRTGDALNFITIFLIALVAAILHRMIDYTARYRAELSLGLACR